MRLGGPSTDSGRTRRLTGAWAAAAVLAAFWVLMLASLRNQAMTFDELGHVTAGYTYWRFDDFRLDPENGNLPQRIAALPLLWGGFRFPPIDNDAWHQSDFWTLGIRWFQEMGNDMTAMLERGRAACGLMAVALGALVWWWSRRLNGPVGGMLSLVLFVLCPTVLANGALMTSDTATALFFLAACLGWWSVLHRVTPGRLAASALAAGGLFISKDSAVLIVPIALILLAARLADGRPLPVRFFGAAREIAGRGRQGAVLGLAVLAHAIAVIAVIWAFYGFRFTAFANPQPGRDHMYGTWEQRMDAPLMPALFKPLGLSPEQTREISQLLRDHAIVTNLWTWDALQIIPVIEHDILTPAQARQLETERAAPPAGWTHRVLDWTYRHRLLPESYLFGMARVLEASEVREAFLNGHYSVHGWFWFFPYTVLVKTPLPFFGVMILAIAAAFGSLKPFRSRLYDTLPLWTLMIVYWAAILHAEINIGHRHVLPAYPPAIILFGSAAVWLSPATRRMGAALAALVVLLAVNVLWRYPDYLAFFNVFAGGPRNAYRHLVDSSLDWGQDLPEVKRYVDEHHVLQPYYLSYFGAPDPNYYHIGARPLYSYMNLMPTPILPLQVSADRLDFAKADIVRRNPDMEFVAAVDQGGDRDLVIFLEKPEYLRLSGGTYFVSATLLQGLEHNLDGPWGHWNARYEATYQRLSTLVKPFLEDDPGARWAALTSTSFENWVNAFADFHEYRFSRLAAYLRHRQPDGWAGYSILVYRLTDAEVARALDGPPAELGPDMMQTSDPSLRLGAAP